MTNHHFGEDYGDNPAENYERFFVPAIGAPLAADLVGRASLQPGERVLDVACGTGIVARLAAEEVGAAGAVAGLDINPGMLAVARSIAPQDASIEWDEASAEEMPLPDNSIDVVLCQMGLQFAPDRLHALREMRRVLTSGGRLLLNLPGPATPLFTALADALERNISPEAAGFALHVFSLYDEAEITEMMSAAGFLEVNVQTERMTLRLPAAKEFLWQYVRSTPLAGPVGQADDDARAALERAVLEVWEDFEEDGALQGEQPMAVGTARK
jgi:ubiquinone/menaquinone biosynthesis C-methylase UbiE